MQIPTNLTNGAAGVQYVFRLKDIILELDILKHFCRSPANMLL